MRRFILKLYHNPWLNRLFPTLVLCLQRELRDCRSVLDLGCGPSSPLQYCRNIDYSVGVEIFKPYLIASRRRRIHNKYYNKKITDIDFKPGSFDAVIMIEVLEHLPEKTGRSILKKAEKWARKKVIVSSPNGFVPQKAVDDNPWQKHLSGWDWHIMRRLGFKSRGLAGLRVLRQEVGSNTMGDDLTSSMRFRPRFFWFAVASLSQAVTFYYSWLAFELFSVKQIKKIL